MKRIRIAPVLAALAACATLLGTVSANANTALPAAAAAASVGASGASTAGSLLQVVFSLFLVLAAMAATAWLVKRYAPKRLMGDVPVRIVGGVSLGGRERVVVIEVADQWIVVGTAPGRVNTLATMPRQHIEAAPDVASAPNFALWLKQTIDKRNQNNQDNQSNQGNQGNGRNDNS